MEIIDSPVYDRFISPAPGQQNNMQNSRLICMNEDRQYITVAPRNNGTSLPIVMSSIKKIGTLGLFLRKVSDCVFYLVI